MWFFQASVLKRSPGSEMDQPIKKARASPPESTPVAKRFTRSGQVLSSMAQLITALSDREMSCINVLIQRVLLQSNQLLENY